MKLFLDVNVVLDVILLREPWFVDAAQLLAAVERKKAEGFLAAHTITTIHYVVARVRGREVAARALRGLLRIIEVVAVEERDFQKALRRRSRDFEDAVQAISALKVGADYFVTRNEQDFRQLTIPVVTPACVLALISSNSGPS